MWPIWKSCEAIVRFLLYILGIAHIYLPMQVVLSCPISQILVLCRSSANHVMQEVFEIPQRFFIQPPEKPEIEHSDCGFCGELHVWKLEARSLTFGFEEDKNNFGTQCGSEYCCYLSIFSLEKQSPTMCAIKKHGNQQKGVEQK